MLQLVAKERIKFEDDDTSDNSGYGTFVKDLVCTDDIETTGDTEKLIEEDS